MIEEGKSGSSLGKVVIIYTQFISSLTQKAAAFQLLPIEFSQNDSPANVYEFEPEVGPVLDEAIRLYTEAKLMQARIESAASEHAMRMVAMGNANRNASDLIDSLTLELNATRQAAITQEIAEITGGAEAIAA
jgi:F-type H+-transporting ATPase subunit gamma